MTRRMKHTWLVITVILLAAAIAIPSLVSLNKETGIVDKNINIPPLDTQASSRTEIASFAMG